MDNVNTWSEVNIYWLPKHRLLLWSCGKSNKNMEVQHNDSIVEKRKGSCSINEGMDYWRSNNNTKWQWSDSIDGVIVA